VETSLTTHLSAFAAQGRRPVVWLAAGLLAWGALLAMAVTTEGLAEDDRPVLSWLASHRSSAVTPLMEFVSSSTVAVLVPVAVIATMLTIGVVEGSWCPLATVLLTFGGASLVSLGLKSIVQRARPSSTVMLGDPATGWSFPSGHTLLTSALLGAVVLIGWRRSSSGTVRAVTVVTAAAAALLMGFSRMYLGDHWLTDVLASYALAVSVLAGTAVVVGGQRWFRPQMTASTS
jgi:membrane-associated phospholipid phosphatase